MQIYATWTGEQPFFLWLIRDSISSKLILILIKKCGKRQFCHCRYSWCATSISLISSRLAFWSHKISGTGVEWIFLLHPHLKKKQLCCCICDAVIIIDVPGRSLVISAFSKQTFCGSESPQLDKKFWLFTNKKAFKWILLDLLCLSLGLSNINFF